MDWQISRANVYNFQPNQPPIIESEKLLFARLLTKIIFMAFKKLLLHNAMCSCCCSCCQFMSLEEPLGAYLVFVLPSFRNYLENAHYNVSSIFLLK
jgi:hypothetical protein